jgi:hypothetical protein
MEAPREAEASVTKGRLYGFFLRCNTVKTTARVVARRLLGTTRAYLSESIRNSAVHAADIMDRRYATGP